MKKFLLVALLALICLCAAVTADLPVHCLFHQIQGDWTLMLTRNGESKDVVHVCTLESPLDDIQQKITVTLDIPDIIRDPQSGKNIGLWTLIYDQGFELSLNGNKYFAFFNYTKDGDDVTSHCDRTFTGWYHTDVLNSNNWGCFRAVKTSHNPLIQAKNVHKETKPSQAIFNAKFSNDAKYIQQINNAKLGWVAKSYPQFEGKSVMEMQRIAGGQVVNHKRKANMKSYGKFMTALKNVKTQATIDLPKNFDWRNVSGVNYVSPVRNQGGCGSCYVFATLGMFEARSRIQSKGQQTPTFSPQDVVSCSVYSQGCDGGFPFLVGKYAEDFGLTFENCDPYEGADSKCNNICPATQTRLYATDYAYVGGYYGATNERNMMEELYKNGPIAIAFEVYRDFYNYAGGIYRHRDSVKFAEPEPKFEETNHAVLLVGWGESDAGEKYWIVKNSWGEGWGLDGYFLIVRGEDNCAIESLAVSANPHAYA